MLRNKIYYRLKPFIPSLLRMAVRKKFAGWMRKRTRDVWPIMPGSEYPPTNWPGWPENKKFAFVLTHDVEGPAGLSRCRQLMQLEMQVGVRSSFNFIPEGTYRVPGELRDELTSNGFEVGVHDFQHDGHLFASRKEFARKAVHINHYISEWGASGFRSGFMLHKLDWLHELEIEYDMSTFDTDPFEPQPEGRHTVFPFWVARLDSCLDQSSILNSSRAGYIELPYTLPQDSTLFLLLGEQTERIWLRKLDWIAEHGGMALVNIHPDYIDFGASIGSRNTYPVSRISALLKYVTQRYAGAFWNPCPKELARWYKRTCRLPSKPLTLDTGDLGRNGPPPRTLQGKRAAVLLYSYYPADPRPRRAAEAFVEAGMEVDLVCLKEDETELKTETVHGVRVLRTPVRKTRGNKPTYLIQYGRFFLACFAFLTRRSLRAPYDVVHVHNMPDLLVFAAIVPKLFGTKIILDLHDPMPELMMSIYGFNSDHWLVRLLRKIERWSIGYADLAITPNIAFKNLFVSRSCSEKKIQIVMNSPQQKIFDPDRFAAERKTPNTNGQFRIMHHGSIVHRHGIDLLIQALAQVRKVVPEVRLDIYGSPTSFLDTVVGLAQQLGIADIVHYHGTKPQNEIAEAIRDCDLGVVPNRRSAFTEINFPTRLFEYLSMHRPVLAPATQGIQDYFDPKQLIMFEPDNVRDLVAKILWVHEQPQDAQAFVERGIQVYRRNLWHGEKERFLEHVAEVLKSSKLKK